jgi:hypothetical protein
MLQESAVAMFARWRVNKWIFWVKSGHRGNLVIHTALWYYARSLLPRQRMQKTSLSVHTCSLRQVLRSLPGFFFACTKATPAIACSERGIQVRNSALPPSLWTACGFICEWLFAKSLSFPWTASLEVKWSGCATLPHYSGRLSYLGFCFEGDVCEWIAVRLMGTSSVEVGEHWEQTK